MTTRDLMKALPIHYKEYFESKLAIELLKHPELFPVVKRISHRISDLIHRNQDVVLRVITHENKKMVEELYGKKIFGRLHGDEITAKQIMQDMLAVLQDEFAELSQVMQVHALFIYRIYGAISSQEISHSNDLFKDRGRKLIASDKNKLSKKMGIMHDSAFSILVDEHKEDHCCAVDIFMPDENSKFYREMLESNIPFAAGVSSHTATFMLGVQYFKEDIQEYALAAFAFLAAGGNHSFHEVMVVAKQAGAVYEINNYLGSIPEGVKQSAVFACLVKEFPEFLSVEEQAKDQLPLYKNILGRFGFIKTAYREIKEKLAESDRLTGMVLQYAG